MHSTLNKIAVSKASNPHARFDLIVDISCARAWFMNNYFIKQLSYLTWYVCCHLALHGLAKCTCPSLKYFFSNLRKTPRRKFSSVHQSKIGILLKDSFFKINLEKKENKSPSKSTTTVDILIASLNTFGALLLCRAGMSVFEVPSCIQNNGWHTILLQVACITMKLECHSFCYNEILLLRNSVRP